VIGALGGAGIAMGPNMGNNTYYGGYALAALGIGGALYDIFTGKLNGVSPQPATVVLEKTPEVQAREREEAERMAQIAAEEAARVAQQRAEEEAKRKAEAKAAAKAAEDEAKFNPNKLDRSQYKKVAIEDFSFDMVAGKLSAGSKVAFEAKFLFKPTGTEYSFRGVDLGITLSSDHNFVRDMPDWSFGSADTLFGRLPQQDVTVYVTVKKPGQLGECSVDIVEW
jgi:hypothetical protein